MIAQPVPTRKAKPVHEAMNTCDYTSSRNAAKCLAMNMNRKLSITLLTVPFLAHPAIAGETDWEEIGPGSRIRLISSDSVADGSTLAAIEIEMPETTKTYWRIPGETGIPILFDASASRGVRAAEILWPYPERQTTGGFIDFVYHGHTVLPVQLAVDSDTPRLEAELILGVCDEICVPVKVTLALDMQLGKGDAGQSFRIKQAMADVPQTWTQGTQPIGDITADAATGRVDVTYTPGVVDPDSIIIDTGKPTDLFSLPQKSPESGIISFQLLDADKGSELAGRDLTVTFVAKDGVFELKKTVQDATGSGGNS